MPILKEGENYTDSYQCQYISFCNKQSKKCEELFHYENNADATDYATFAEKMGFYESMEDISLKKTKK